MMLNPFHRYLLSHFARIYGGFKQVPLTPYSGKTPNCANLTASAYLTIYQLIGDKIDWFDADSFNCDRYKVDHAFRLFRNAEGIYLLGKP